MKGTLLSLYALTILVLVACAPVEPAANNTTNVQLPTIDLPAEEVPSSNEGSTESNAAPAEDFAAHLTFTEGDLVRLKTLAVDPDKDKVTLQFSKPFENDGVWQTKVGDAGDYPVSVVARDTKGAESRQRILVTIKHANRAPVITGADSLSVREGEKIVLDYSAQDPDGDDVILSYSGWMKAASYTPTFEDSGVHEVIVTAEDGKTTTKKVVTITVGNSNRAPTLSLDKTHYTVTELQRIALEAAAADPDGDKVTVEFGEPLASDGTWTPQLDDAGEYTVTVTASDGTLETTKEIQLTVTPTNRAPKVTVPTKDGVLSVKEGDVIDMRNMIFITDPEGEEVAVTYSGWMNTPTYQTTFEDAGQHQMVVVAADDSMHTTTVTVTVIVADVNRPPVFVQPA